MGVGLRPGRCWRPTEAGVGMFADEEGSTTVAAAVAILVCLALLFGLANVQWASSRAADIQVVADAGALAGANAVAAYATAAQVLDALVLSMGLIGVLVLAIGLVLCAIPLTSAAGPPVLEAAQRVFVARTSLAQTAAKGLQKLEAAVPYLVAANAFATARGNVAPEGSYMGIAVPYPLEGSSDFGDLDADNAADKVRETEERGREVDELTRQADDAKLAADDALERGWRVDCGGDTSMRERAEALAGMSGALNPNYPTSTGWDFGVPILRARSYYAQRLARETPSDASPAEASRSAARKAFYRYALEQVDASSYTERGDGTVSCDLRDLPANTQDVRGTSLYTDAAWPCSQESAGRVLHGYTGCPGARGPSAGTASLADQEVGDCLVCAVCQFTVVDVGRAPAASTSIENGFEHYWRAVVEASRDYEVCRAEQAERESAAREAAERARDSFREALERLTATRVELCPPGRYGCVCVVLAGSAAAPDLLTGELNAGTNLPYRVAVAGAVLAEDEAATGNTILSGFFDGLVAQGGWIGGGSSVLDAIASVWGDLLVSYGDGYRAFSQTMDDAFKRLSDLGLGNVSTWLKGALGDAASLTAMQPADLSAKKPVLANSADVMARSGDDARGMLNAVVAGAAHARPGVDGMLSALGVGILTMNGTGKITVAEFTVPGTDITVPLEVDLGWLAELDAAA